MATQLKLSSPSNHSHSKLKHKVIETAKLCNFEDEYFQIVKILILRKVFPNILVNLNDS